MSPIRCECGVLEFVDPSTNDRFYMTDKILILTTAGSEKEAGEIAQALVERRLAACVNVLPKIASVYRWNQNVERAEEWMLVIKTRSGKFAAVRDAIKELHSFDLPECIAVEIHTGSAEYLKWIDDSV
jgi:periplasmic divalent cation tolerance protein